MSSPQTCTPIPYQYPYPYPYTTQGERAREGRRRILSCLFYFLWKDNTARLPNAIFSPTITAPPLSPESLNFFSSRPADIMRIMQRMDIVFPYTLLNFLFHLTLFNMGTVLLLFLFVFFFQQAQLSLFLFICFTLLFESVIYPCNFF